MLKGGVYLLMLAGICAADPTRFLVQDGKVAAPSAFFEGARLDAKERYERAMTKLQGDRARMVQHEREFVKEAKQLRLRAETPIHHN